MTEVATTSSRQMRRLAVFLDGTWNAVGTNTNVWRLRSLLAERDDDGIEQQRYYDVGVNGAVGGAWGKGLSENVQEAYNWLVDNYDEGDQIYIFGFSRGAHTARSLAGFIAICGLLRPGGPLGVDQLFQRYRHDDDRTIYRLADPSSAPHSFEEQWMLKYSRPVPIELVGVWDTVGALGIPAFNIPGISQSALKFHHTGLRKPIRSAFHAIAVDEHRAKFAHTPWTVRTRPGANAPAPMRPLDCVEQRWFVGAHANVGGGCYNDALAQLPLRWMMRKANGRGLAFRNELELNGSEHLGPISDSYREFMKGAYSWVSRRNFRAIAPKPHTAQDGSTHRRVNETIDKSVFRRWIDDPTYRPENIVDWAERYGVDPCQINQSVVATEPQSAAPE